MPTEKRKRLRMYNWTHNYIDISRSIKFFLNDKIIRFSSFKILTGKLAVYFSKEKTRLKKKDSFKDFFKLTTTFTKLRIKSSMEGKKVSKFSSTYKSKCRRFGAWWLVFKYREFTETRFLYAGRILRRPSSKASFYSALAFILICKVSRVNFIPPNRVLLKVARTTVSSKIVVIFCI